MSQGLSLRVNPLFLLIFIVFSLAGMFQEVLIAFIIVLLHEFVHLLVAGKAGYRVNQIELFPFGGVAEYRGLMEMEPWQEVKVALAGPLFNFTLVAIFYMLIFSGIYPETELISLVMKYNLLIGGFNLIPALPLDGGRILRALLVSKWGFQKGTLVSVRIAKMMSLSGGIAGVIGLLLNLSNIWFLFISFFVYGAAVKEEKQILYRLLSYLTHREEVVKALKIKLVFAQVVQGELPLKEVIYDINPVKFNLFYVLDVDSNLAGVVTELRLLSSFFEMKDGDVKVIDLI